MTFTSIALFNLLTVPLKMFPMALSNFISAYVSSKRLVCFLLKPEVEGIVMHDGKNKYAVIGKESVSGNFIIHYENQ